MFAEGDIVIRAHKHSDLNWVFQIPLSEFGFDPDFPRRSSIWWRNFVRSLDEKRAPTVVLSKKNAWLRTILTACWDVESA
jgi:hypothetical protein